MTDGAPAYEQVGSDWSDVAAEDAGIAVLPKGQKPDPDQGLYATRTCQVLFLLISLSHTVLWPTASDNRVCCTRTTAGTPNRSRAGTLSLPKPDVVRPGVVGMRGRMATEIRPCMT